MSTQARQTPSSKSLWLALGFGGIALFFLISLGTWQVQRMAWKEDLIATVQARLSNAPEPLLQAIDNTSESENEIEYKPIMVSGEYVPDEVFFEFTTFKGNSGWHLFHLLKTDPQHTRGSPYMLVNRGFIPYDARQTWQSVAPLPVGAVEVVGLLRTGQPSKPGVFMPDNEPSERTFYWRSVTDMAVASGLDPDDVALWYVDRGIPGQANTSDEFPIAGNTIIKFSNNHLQYAVTWYGLALTLVGVLGFWLFGRRRRAP